MDTRLGHGILVAIEGIDGAGKTTQVDRLQHALASVGLRVIRSKEPTAGPWGQRIRESARTGRMSLEDELHTFEQDRREHVTSLLRPELDAGAVVIVDRYYYSTATYQGARGADPDAIVARNRAFAPRPDVLIILDIDAADGVDRVRGRDGEENLFERVEDLEVSARIFREHASAWGAVVIDATQEPDAITSQILDALQDHLIDRLPAIDVFRPHAPTSDAADAIGRLFAQS